MRIIIKTPLVKVDVLDERQISSTAFLTSDLIKVLADAIKQAKDLHNAVASDSRNYTIDEQETWEDNNENN